MAVDKTRERRPAFTDGRGRPVILVDWNVDQKTSFLFGVRQQYPGRGGRQARIAGAFHCRTTNRIQVQSEAVVCGVLLVKRLKVKGQRVLVLILFRPNVKVFQCLLLSGFTAGNVPNPLHARQESESLRARILIRQLQTFYKFLKLSGVDRRTYRKQTGGGTQHLNVQTRSASDVGSQLLGGRIEAFEIFCFSGAPDVVRKESSAQQADDQNKVRDKISPGLEPTTL